jgi:hypothetical protein
MKVWKKKKKKRFEQGGETNEGYNDYKGLSSIANSNRKNNFIDQLVVNGTISSYHFVIKEHIVHYYNNLFTKQFNWRLRLNDILFYSIGEGGHLVGETIQGRSL